MTHGFYCQSYDTSGVSATATVTNIDRNTGVVTCSLWVAGMKHSPGMQNAAGNFSFSITIPGGISLQKVSSNEDITNGNSCYSLAGAEYSVFWDAGCTNPTGAVLVTDENGYAEIGNVSPGTYWVKETKAAPGYSLDSNPYQVNVSQGCVTRVNGDTVSDIPQNDPVNVLVRKVDAETGQPYPLGGATLEKSQFTVRYYDTTDAWSLSSDYATRCAAAKRTWVYETDEWGSIDCQKQRPVSGDEIYTTTDDFGNTKITLPVGTYVIEETKPPTGYLLPSCQGRTFIEVITAEEGSDKAEIDKYHTEVYKPISTESGTLANGTPYTYTGLNWSSWKIDGE